LGQFELLAVSYLNQQQGCTDEQRTRDDKLHEKQFCMD
jgi:hypothetical protein